MTEPNRLPALEAASLIRDGKLSSERLTAACLARITERDEDVQAWAHLSPGIAMAQAQAADKAQANGAALGPLHGIPVGIKDIIDTVEWPTENGTVILHGRQPTQEAEVVSRLKAAGAVILGKTVTTELAFFGPGKTRNPHNGAHTPGGSSSGSAAAVADFQVPLALGTQTAGSIIRPAAYCGVIGFKPTFGTVSTKGVLAQSPPLDTIGGYARTPNDVAALIAAMGGPALTAAAKLGPTAPRFAFIRSEAWSTGDEAMQRDITNLVSWLGPLAQETAMPSEFAAWSGLQRAVQFHDIAANYGPLLDAHPGQISTKLADVIADGRTVTAAEYASALAARDALYHALSVIFSRCDVILTPAAAGPAPLGLASTGSPAFNFLWTYLGCPAINVPTGSERGLPLGVQLVGPRGADAAVIAAAQWLFENQPK